MKSGVRLAAYAVVCLSIFVLPSRGQSQTYKGKELVKAELLADTNAIVLGKPFTIGLLLRMAPGWHTYWKFSGDAGLPTEIKWKLPPGWKIGEIQWPIPLKTTDPGDIQTYGYQDEVLLMQEITPPAAVSGSTVKLVAEANWLVCEKICIPGNASLQLELPRSTTSAPANAEIFARYRRLLPRDWPGGKVASANWRRTGSDLRLNVKSATLANYPNVDFYPLPQGDTVVGHPQLESRSGNEIVFRVPLESVSKDLSSIQGLVVFAQRADGSERAAWQIPTSGIAPVKSTASIPARGIFTFLLFGFLPRVLNEAENFELDAVCSAGHLAQNFRLHSARGAKPSENFAERGRLCRWNFRLVYRSGVVSNRAQSRRSRNHLGRLSIH